MLHGARSCPLNVRNTSPVIASHTLAVRSRDVEAMRLPSGLKATLVTQVVCPLKVSGSLPDATSHTFTAPSFNADARRLPSRLKQTLSTSRVCALRVRTGGFRSIRSPAGRRLRSHTRTVLSSADEANRLPSGLKQTPVIPPACPSRVKASCPDATSHTLTVPSCDPEARRMPSGL